ncbi:hypothetical protein ABI59_18685 [Acidobacteria bacterium Mor1]|nr:hypothetical protein ABI59_18685 [Acidobacteria bacterium Mor1]
MKRPKAAFALRRGTVRLVRLLLPGPCFACGRPIPGRPYLGACASCWSALRPLGWRGCPQCGLPRPGGSDALGPAGLPCGECLQRSPTPHPMCAAVLYRGTARRFLLRAKSGRPELLDPLGDQLAEALGPGGFATDRSCVCFVPAHPFRRLRRGFNPAERLARRVASALTLPLRRFTTVHALRHGSPAKGRTAFERLTGARRFKPLLGATGERVLLVDDVLTTGATARDCATALLESGARSVHLAVWARALPRFDRSSGGLL